MGEILRFLSQVLLAGGGAAAVLYLILKTLGEKWIEQRFAQRLEEYKHAQIRELEHYKYEINSLFNRITKIHEKEFEILPSAWQKLQDALGKVAQFTSPVQTYPDLNNMTDVEVNEALSSSKLSGYHKRQILTAPDRLKFYTAKVFWYELNEAKHCVSDFHNYILHNKIFLSTDLFEQFQAIDNLLYGALLDREIGKQADDYTLILRAYKEIQEKSGPIVAKIEALVQKRLHYDLAE